MINFDKETQVPGFKKGLRDFPKDLTTKTITAGVVAAIFGCTGPALIVIQAATDGGLTEVQTISWLFSIYFFGGLLSIILALRYKMPIVGAYSIPAAAMMVTVIQQFSIYEAAGAYLISGIIVLLLGLSGIIGKTMKWIPLPIVMAMIAGAMIKFGVNIIANSVNSPIIGMSALIGFLILPKIARRIPAVLGAILLGMIAAAFTGQLNFAGANFEFIGPQLITPQFSLGAIISISIPLSVLVIGAENAQATGVLISQKYKPPINTMTIFSGVGGILTAMFGGHNANIAGPMTAICSSEEAGNDKEKRYTASVVNGILFGLFGVVASISLAFVSGLPGALVSIVSGLAMINVLYGAYHIGFGTNKFKLGAFFALAIALSGVTIFKISAPFWALVGGVIVSYIAERQDFEVKEELKEKLEEEKIEEK
ncbi:MAG: benzoate/H(+) symporter BenE family transporter [Tissierellales bacterium]|jgi:benzoate membrane transport protein|nr:benzoate/H(+) symporter BenE family transporter [Tissierellales bacterium]